MHERNNHPRSLLLLGLCDCVSVTVSEECERTLRVSGIPENADVDDIYAMFESERIGGGPVEQIHRLDVCTALITFADNAGMQRQ